MTANLRAFLGLLFEPDEHLLVEVVQERRPGVERPRCLARRWWKPEHLLAQVDVVAPWALDRHAAVYFGVLARRPGTANGAGAVPGRVVWADLDDAEARARLADWHTPTATVASGRGIHAYWTLDERHPPGVLAEATARVALRLGGDRVGDTARVLRLPGTWWAKADPPRRVEMIDLEPARRWSLAELVAGLPDAPTVAASLARLAAEALQPPPAWLLARVDADPRLAQHWRGEAGGTSRSERDFRLVLALARRGLTDREALAALLWARPEGAARSRANPGDYLVRTVGRALAVSDGWRRR